MIIKYQEFIQENINKKTLYVFDLDDTLIRYNYFDKAAIDFLKETVEIEEILKKSVKQIGKNIHDIKWQNDRLYIDDLETKPKGDWVRKKSRLYLTVPEEYAKSNISLPSSVIEKTLKVYNEVKDKAIITGRVDEIKSKLLSTLKDLGIKEPNKGFFCYEKESGLPVAKWKSNIILKLIKDNDYKKVYYYDDNSKISKRIKSFVKKEFPKLEWITTIVR